MKLSELKSHVDRAIDHAIECGEDPTQIPVALQLNKESDGEPIWSYEDLELHYDNNADASGCVISATVAYDSLFSVFDECLNVHPFLLIEVGYNRVTDWMVHIYDATGVPIKSAERIISTQSVDRENAMAEATKQLRARFPSGN